MKQAGEETPELKKGAQPRNALQSMWDRFMQRTWKSSHLLIAADIVFVLGVGIGNATQQGEAAKTKKDLASARSDVSSQKEETNKAKSALKDATSQVSQSKAALDEANRRLAQTTTLPPTTSPPTTPAPATTTTAAGPKTTFGNGQYRVGTDIAAGTYVAPGGSGCYWERQSTFGGGGVDSIIANDLSRGGQVVVTISASDKGFKTSGCGTWTPS